MDNLLGSIGYTLIVVLSSVGVLTIATLAWKGAKAYAHEISEYQKIQREERALMTGSSQ